MEPQSADWLGDTGESCTFDLVPEFLKLACWGELSTSTTRRERVESVDCDEMREIQADEDAGMFHRIQDLRGWVTRMDAGRHGFFMTI